MITFKWFFYLHAAFICIFWSLWNENLWYFKFSTSFELQTFFSSICTSVRAQEKLYIPQWNARSNFLIISRAGCETASGPGLGSLAGVDCRVQWSVTGRDRGNSCIQVRGYDFILQLHLCVYRAFHQERKESHACCASFSFGCCRHDICNKSFLYPVGL